MRKFLLTLVLVFLTANLSAGNTNSKVEDVLRSYKLQSAEVGIYAVPFSKNAPIVSINKDLPLNPASCMKLITSAVALKELGPDFQFSTKFYIAGNDLWVKGFGDPSFVIERLVDVVDRLVKAGLPASIKDIIIDDSFFAMGDFPGRQKGSARSYNALTSAVALNHGSVTVEVSPNAKQGQPAVVTIDAPGIEIENKAQTGPKRGRSNIKISRVYTKHGDTVKVTGRISLTSPTRKQFFSVANPTKHFGDALSSLLVEKGINIGGYVRTGVVPTSAKLLMEEKSQPLAEVLKNMNKHSNNFMAEQITKVVGAKVFGEPGTTDKGVKVFSNYLNSLGAKNFSIENGSGLNYNNEVSANDLVKVMTDIYSDRKLRDIFVDSLSVAGEDGTLKKCNSACLARRMKAKTGSLNRISCLAGFLPDKDQMIIFAILLNGGKVDFVTGHRASQKIAEVLLEK